MADLHDKSGGNPFQKYRPNISRESPCWLFTTSYMPGWSFGRSAGCGWQASSLSREYSRRSKSDGSSLPFLYKLSWGLEVKLKDSLDDVHYFLRTWCLPFLSSSLFSTGLCCILILWSTVGWRYGFSPTELMKVPLHAFLDTTGRVHELLCACPQYGDT